MSLFSNQPQIADHKVRIEKLLFDTIHDLVAMKETNMDSLSEGKMKQNKRKKNNTMDDLWAQTHQQDEMYKMIDP